MRGKPFETKVRATNALLSPKFHAEVSGGEGARAVLWRDLRAWPSECDVCGAFVDEPVASLVASRDEVFETWAVVVGRREMGLACSRECAEVLRDSYQVVAVLEEVK